LHDRQISDAQDQGNCASQNGDEFGAIHGDKAEGTIASVADLPSVFIGLAHCQDLVLWGHKFLERADRLSDAIHKNSSFVLVAELTM
jgi:hypothetical protein